jgi:hypothetical protein
VVAILIAVIAIFYLRRRSQTRSAMSAGAGVEGPLSDGGTLASPGPGEMKLYVCVIRPPRCILCVLMCHLPNFCTLRTRMTRLLIRSLLISEVEPPCPTRCPKTGHITATPLSDLAFRRDCRSPGRIVLPLLVIPSSICLQLQQLSTL